MAAALLITLSSSAVTPTRAAASGRPAYLNSHLPVQARVADLLRRMTLPEKIGQTAQVEATEATDKTNNCTSTGGFNMPNPVCEQKVFVDQNVGSILAGGSDIAPDTTGQGGVGNTGLDWANEYNTMQSYAMAHSRLHIPVIFGVDAVHGFGHPWQAPLFPQSIGMGATWDPSAAMTGGEVTGNALRATGWNWDFAPVQDVSRDNRWGRYYEAWSEEPALAAAMGGAYVHGVQSGGAGGLKVTATVKHFAGYSESINGHDRVQAELPIRYLQDTFLPSYAGAIDAGSGTVMVDSGSVNGIPATASHFLLTTELRDRLGFKGVVISDYGDVGALATTYHMAPDLAGAAALAINAGVDVAMLPFNADQWQTAVQQDVQDHSISMATINQAVSRILTLKFQLGLFDHPLVDASKADAAVESGRDATLQAARESITLLRNQGNVLPLSPSSKLVVTGPNADNMAYQLGGWSVAWQGAFDSGHCCEGPANQIPPGTTVLAGLKGEDSNVTFAPDQATAVADAANADAVVVAVGEKAYAEGLGDNPAPQLTPDQQNLVSALEKTGKPVIVVVVAGRPLGLGPAEQANAILMAYQGSTEAGQAVADAIFGKIDPSGKLPVTWPSDAAAPGGDFSTGAPSPLGDEPKFFDQLSYTGSGQGSGYNPLYPFGYGLSYTTFSASGLTATSGVSRRGTVTATFTVSNTGSRAGTDIVPVYVHQPVSVVLVPPQRLVGFTRVTLDPGQSKTVQVTFGTSELAVTPGDINGDAAPQVETGAYQVQIGTPASLSANLTIHG
jgi:beta-glucosidase